MYFRKIEEPKVSYTFHNLDIGWNSTSDIIAESESFEEMKKMLCVKNGGNSFITKSELLYDTVSEDVNFKTYQTKELDAAKGEIRKYTLPKADYTVFSKEVDHLTELNLFKTVEEVLAYAVSYALDEKCALSIYKITEAYEFEENKAVED